MANQVALFRTRLEGAGAYELALADTLCEILAHGSHDLPSIVEGLRTSDLEPPDGSGWTEEAFLAEIKRLGLGPVPGHAPAPRL